MNSTMLLRGGFSASNAVTAATGDRNQRFFNSVYPQRRNHFVPHPSLSLPSKGRVMAVATDGVNTKQVAGSGNEPSLADRLRLGSLVEDGLSYKEKFIVRCYEVGINKTATVETIANLLQVMFEYLISGLNLILYIVLSI